METIFGDVIKGCTLVRVICPKTVFGEIVKDFTSESDAADWALVCEDNDVPYTVEYI